MEIVVSREYLASKAFLWDTCETFYSASLSSLIHTFCAYTIYTYITHKCWGELLRENPSQTTWELEIGNKHLKDLGTESKLGLEGLLLTHVSQLIV